MKNEKIVKNDYRKMEQKRSLKARFAVVVFAVILIAAFSGYANAATCSFKAGAYAIAFGVLDPSLGANVTMAVAPAVTFKCPAPIPTFTMSVDAGLHPSGGSPQLANATLTSFIKYSVTISPTAGLGGGGFMPLTMTATVNGVDYRNAAAGAYTDTLTLTVLP